MISKKLLLLSPWLIILGLVLYIFSPNELPKSFEKTTSNNPKSSPQNTSQIPAGTIKVSRVIDGDTIELENGERVRYIGIDTPESVHPEKPVECLSNEATLKNKELVENKHVILEKDIQEKDKHDRTLAYVWSDNKLINETLVKEGFAKVSTIPPNVRYQELFLNSEKEARNANRGLWSPNACAASETPPTTQSSCLIKGNISSSGEKIYHIEGQRYYDKTKIEEEKGERWFCTEKEAVESGWRKSKV